MVAIKKDGKYLNKPYITMQMSVKKAKNMMKDYITKKDTLPPFKIPRKTIDKNKFEEKDSFVWLGHSTILSRLNNVSFIVDPMLSLRASPLKFLGPKRFEGSLVCIDELPKIDIILITHNHYDHMDKDTILAFQNRVKLILVPLDNAKILKKWGVKEEKIMEFDWFEELLFNNITFTFCPTQHFSGRSLSDRDKYLWGSWAIKGLKHSIYVSGDSGYNKHFEEISQKLGGFDLACMECGAYNENWSEIHMLPEESVQAAVDIKAKVMLPMHWAGFDLSTHAWDEPITRALKKAEELNMKVTTPMIAEVQSFEDSLNLNRWWQKL